MELQFQKKSLSCLTQLKWENKEQEQTQELRLADSLPDIGRVLCAWGQVLLRSKEWHASGAGVSGGVMVWVLYKAEGTEEVLCVDTWIPFKLQWDLPQTTRDGNLLVSAALKTVDARSTSARKLMVRVVVSAAGQAVVPGEKEYWVPEELPEDVQLLRKDYPVQLPVEAGEKPFMVEELLDAPRQMKSLLRYCLQPEIIDKRVVGNKAVFRGAATLHLLYRTQEDGLETKDYELPFSQFTELEHDYEEDAEVSVLPAVTSLELEQTEEGKLSLKAGMTGQYMIHARKTLPVVEDAYSPGRKVSCVKEQLALPVVLDQLSKTVTAEQDLELMAAEVIDTAFFPEQPVCAWSDTGPFVDLSAQLQALYKDMEGTIQCAGGKWQGQWRFDAEESVQFHAKVSATGAPQGMLTSGLSLSGQLLAEVTVSAGEQIETVSVLELGDAIQPDPNRPSLILRRAGKQTLWQLAKATGSTVETILAANGLATEPDSDQMLLIPIP